MAKKTSGAIEKVTFGRKKNRKGIHSKSKSSKIKASKSYMKRYRGQGK